MSMFSGKCDLYDHINISLDSKGASLNELLDNTSFFIHGKDKRDHELSIKSEKDLAKYYPYLVAMGSFSDGKCTIVLSSDSFIDTEERDRLQWRLDDTLKFWRKCKKSKIEFNVDEYIKHNTYFYRSNLDRQIAEVVLQYGNKTTMDNIKHIHDDIHEYYRNIWYKELLRVGWDEFHAGLWVYGWIRDKEELQRRIIHGEHLG